ncbi:hypothetical protein [Kitasatospora camelliae]|uniref:Uncharacterized protein n=1 Tax=Kitasatospora camelliae TaxID=3156397 RepID=A0AAU8JPV3_9ACTN
MDTPPVDPADLATFDAEPWVQGHRTVEAAGVRIGVRAHAGAVTLHSPIHDPAGAEVTVTAESASP